VIDGVTMSPARVETNRIGRRLLALPPNLERIERWMLAGIEVRNESADLGRPLEQRVGKIL